MKKIKNYEELKSLHSNLSKELTENQKNKVTFRIAMATCSIASGSKPIYDFFADEVKKQPEKLILKATGCTGMCHSEPTVEVILPGKEPVIFGKVDLKKAADIVEKYVGQGQMLDGVLEVI